MVAPNQPRKNDSVSQELDSLNRRTFLLLSGVRSSSRAVHPPAVLVGMRRLSAERPRYAELFASRP